MYFVRSSQQVRLDLTAVLNLLWFGLNLLWFRVNPILSPVWMEWRIEGRWLWGFVNCFFLWIFCQAQIGKVTESVQNEKRGPTTVLFQIFRIATNMGIVIHLAAIIHLLLLPSFKDIKEELIRVDDRAKAWPIEEKYAQDCNLNLTTFTNDMLLEVFYLCHLFGWMCGNLLIRNFYLTFSLSLFDEVIEYTFEHFFAPFRECWWDHVLDIFIANLPGCLIASLIMKLAGMEEWPFLHPRASKRRISLFLISVFVYRFIQFCIPFGLKDAIGVPNNHWMFLYIPLLYTSVTYFSYREHYFHIIPGNQQPAETTPVEYSYRFMALFVMFIDFLFLLKLYEDDFFQRIGISYPVALFLATVSVTLMISTLLAAFPRQFGFLVGWQTKKEKAA